MKDFLFTDLISFVGEAPKKFDGYKKYVSTGAVNGNIIESDDIELVDYSSRPSRANLVACSGDILFAKMAETEKTLLLDDETEKNIYSTGFCAIRAKENIIEPKALYYLLGSSLFLNQKNTNSSGATQRAITNTGLSKIRIKLPTMEKQRVFCGIMDKVVDSIELRKKQLGYFDKFTKSLFIEMFGDPVENPKKWDIIQLHDRCDIVTGNTPAREKSEYYGNYIEWIKSDNINTDDMYLTVAEEYLSKKGLLVGRCVEAGSILMTCIAGSIGCIGNVGVANRKVAFNQQINAIVPNKDSNIFIYWLMVLSKKYIQGTVNMSLKGILSKGKLSELYFPFPPIELQHKFEKNAIVIDKSKLAVKKSLEELEILKKSLMQKYFA